MSTTPLPQEDEFRHLLSSLGKDAREAARYAYLSATIHYRASQNQTLVAVLDRDAGFWNTVLASLQSSAISAVGRIFDASRGVMSARRLLDHAVTYLGIFSRRALRDRKLVARVPPAIAAEFVADAFEPRESDLRPLVDALDVHTDLYNRTIGPIRNQVFAHSGNITRAQVYELFGEVALIDFQRLALFPLSLHNALWELFENGVKPDLPTPPSDIAQLITDPVGEREISSWEQRYMVRDAIQFLRRLESLC